MPYLVGTRYLKYTLAYSLSMRRLDSQANKNKDHHYIVHLARMVKDCTDQIPLVFGLKYVELSKDKIKKILNSYVEVVLGSNY